jgi:tRNA-splicing endonuclease subunit Sen2
MIQVRNASTIAQNLTMADVDSAQGPTNDVTTPKPKLRGPTRSQQLNKLYSLPAPLRTFPLPSFTPNNPISLLHLLYTWVSQTINPPQSHPETLYQGWFSPETRSVHVTDPRSIRALWEQGFYGKGNLSRSELSWLDREKRRRGAAADKTSEEVTRQRRAERQQAKWERARKEREAIDQKLLEERAAALTPDPVINGEIQVTDRPWLAPVGPQEILALPNSIDDLASLEATSKKEASSKGAGVNGVSNGYNDISGHHKEMTDLPNSPDLSIDVSLPPPESHEASLPEAKMNGGINGHAHSNGSANGTSQMNGSSDPSKHGKSPKSVRFSPTVEHNTFIQSEPLSPEIAATTVTEAEEPPKPIKDLEHLQLTMEEAFFLSYGLGVLAVLDPTAKAPIAVKDLFSIFRQASYFPPRTNPFMLPDAPFMISYVVYHHFRSLGWVVRGGTKFSVDFLLYNRGPVFSHAEFAVMIIPSYSDPAWSVDTSTRDYVRKQEKRSWSWLHCVNRVNSQVKKTLVLVYVDIPPAKAHLEEGLGIDGILKRYKIREFVLKRWLSNRSRD